MAKLKGVAPPPVPAGGKRTEFKDRAAEDAMVKAAESGMEARTATRAADALKQLDELPRSHIGKILKTTLRELVSET